MEATHHGFTNLVELSQRYTAAWCSQNAASVAACYSPNGSLSVNGGTGRKVRISGFEVWQIGDDGLIAESRGYFDGAEYERQLADPTRG